MHIGITELILIAIIAIVLIKPEKLGEYMKMFFHAKQTISEAKKEVTKQVDEVKDSVNEFEETVVNKEEKS